MRAELRTDGTLRASHFEGFALILVVGLPLAAVAIWFTSPAPIEGVLWDGILVLLWAGALAGLERSEFVFDRRAQTMSWRKRTPFRRDGGTIPLSAIRSVGVERAVGAFTRSSNALRLMIDSKGGSVPFTTLHSGLTAPVFRVGQQIAAFLSEGGAQTIQFDRTPRFPRKRLRQAAAGREGTHEGRAGD